ncbi:hypothetical protein [Kribbella sp. NPDC048915]|uniref:hypothetical protein n=1 Tax=Kribbella sp. NPDC048915 TaxID=3155148 RepID=UPI0033DC150E
MTPAFRRTAGRLAAAAFGTAALAGAAIAGGHAALAETSCEESAIAKTFNAVLTVRTGPTTENQTCD